MRLAKPKVRNPLQRAAMSANDNRGKGIREIQMPGWQAVPIPQTPGGKQNPLQWHWKYPTANDNLR